jgi:hypothetical protein
MPVILEADQFEPWLSGSAGLKMLKPAANDVLQRWPASRRMKWSVHSRGGGNDREAQP